MKFTHKTQIALPQYIFVLVRLSILMLIYAICRLAFYLYNFDLFPGIAALELANIFWGGMRFDLTGILYLNTLYFITVLLPFYFVYKPKYQSVWNKIFIGLNIIGIAANCFDMIYYPFTLRRTTGAIFKIFKNEEGLWSIFFNGILDFWPVTLLFIILSLVLIWSVRFFKMKESTLKPVYFYPLQTGLLLLSIYLMISGMRSGFGRYTRPIAMNSAGQYVENARNMALVLNTPFSVLRTLRQRAFKMRHDFKDPKELEAVFSPVHKIDNPDPTVRKNVVILILESFGREHSGRLNPQLEDGNYQGYIPFLDSLMDHSLTFSNAYSAGRKSIDAIPAILAGIPCLDAHYVISNYSTNRIHGLGSILKEQGYDVGFFHGAPNGSMGFDAFAKLAGFDKYFGKTEFNNDDFYDGTWGIWDEEFLQYMAEESNKMNKPFCSVFFGLSSHHPWDLPERYVGKFKKGPREFLNCVQYTDNAVRQYFKTVSKRPWYKNTLFVITGDHGAYHYIDEYKTEVGAFAVPIIFFTPDGSLKGMDNRVAQQTDIFPTILDHLNIKTPYFSFGSSLLDPDSKRMAFYHTSGNYRLLDDSLVIEYDGKKFISLYKYIDDRMLHNNLINSGNIKITRLEETMKAVVQQFNNRMIHDKMIVE
jgi:phosphoglycerol transferase MdoB-like AlkP superfamily enzyme